MARRPSGRNLRRQPGLPRPSSARAPGPGQRSGGEQYRAILRRRDEYSALLDRETEINTVMNTDINRYRAEGMDKELVDVLERKRAYPEFASGIA